MATVEEKVKCVLRLAELKSVTAVRRRFTAHYRKDTPHRNSINNWMKKFKETGSVNDKPRSGRPGISEETMTLVEEAFERSPQKSVRRGIY
jgi:transposase